MKQGPSSSSFVQVVTPTSHADSAIHDDHAAPQPPAALYASVFAAFMLPFHYGWSLSQLNLSTFASQPDCDARPVGPGTCLMFPGHSKAEWTYVVNAWVVGGMVGGLSCGSLADRYGRRKALISSSLLMAVGTAIQASASSLAVFAVGRAVAGICSGFATGLSGGYVNEISPPHLRKTLSVGVQLGVATGSLLVVCTFFFANTSSGWRYIAGFPIVYAALLLVLAWLYLVESPAWLLANGKHREATLAMARIYGENNVKLARTWFEPGAASASDVEVVAVEDDIKHQTAVLSPLSQVLSPTFRLQLIGAIGLAAGQQLSGISGVFCYPSSLFKDAGISDDRVGSVIINAMNLLPAFATGYLVTRFGYRKIVLFGFLGMFASGIGITIAFLVDIAALSIVFTGTYVGSFAVSVGPLIYAVMADLFPNSVRATAVSICVFCNYASNLAVGVSFPYLSDALNDFSFVPFVAVVALFYLFAFAMIPETSSRTNNEIQAEFRARREQKL